MTTKEFFQASVFEEATDFFEEVPREGAEGSTDARRSSTLVTSVPAKILRSAVAALAVGILPVSSLMLTGSTPMLQISHAQEAGAAVEVPRLSTNQARGARLVQGLFRPASDSDDAEGDDPDYGF